jgi:EAL domain-containing protein (putative c-di-GMP-specific phosphodiesterase class I)
LAAGDSVIATADIKALFEEAGLQLVVEDIRSEDEFDLVAEHAILYGQGSLFSDPIPVKSEVLGESHEAA